MTDNCRKCWKHPSSISYPDDTEKCCLKKKNDDLSTLITNNNKLTLFNIALNSTTLLTDLDDGNYTIFAPNNIAFEKLGQDTLNTLLEDPEQLTTILKLHIVKGVYNSKMIANIDSLITLNGQNIDINDGTTILSEGGTTSNIINVDNYASNGVLHIIDTVLIPGTTPQESSLNDLTTIYEDENY